MAGCLCGWPIDSCNPKFAKGKPCGKEKHERITANRVVKEGLEANARDHDASVAFYRRAAALIEVPDGQKDVPGL